MFGISWKESERMLGFAGLVVALSLVLGSCSTAKPGSDKMEPGPSASDAGRDSSPTDANPPHQEDSGNQDGGKDGGKDTGTTTVDSGEDTGTTHPIPDADTDSGPSPPDSVVPPMGVDLSPAGGVVRSQGFTAQLMIGIPQPVGRVISEDYIVNVAPNATPPQPID